jgi:hypothetical protein
MIADNLGIVLKMEEVYKAEAKSLGITTGALTNQQKQRAFLNEIIKQGQKSTESVTDSMIKDNTKLSRTYKLVETGVKEYGQTFTELLGFGVEYWVKQAEDVVGYTETVDNLNHSMEVYAAWNKVLIGELDWITKVSGVEEQRNQLLASNIAYKKKLDNEEAFDKYVAKLRRRQREREEKAEEQKNKRIYEKKLSIFSGKRSSLIDEIIEQEKQLDGYNELSFVERIKKDEEYAKFKKENSIKMNKDEREAMLEALREMKLLNATKLDESATLDREAENYKTVWDAQTQKMLKDYQSREDKKAKIKKDARDKEKALDLKHFSILQQYRS